MWGALQTDVIVQQHNKYKKQLQQPEKVEIPMEYDDMNAIEVLEDVRNKLQMRRTQEEKAINILHSNIRDIKTVINNIDEFLEDQKTTNRSMIDPSKCLHINKKINDNGHSETVNCADCGLMLSYKVI